MKSRVVLREIEVHGSEVQYLFSTEGDIQKAFRDNAVFSVDFYEDVESVPRSILAISFATNVLPLIWVYDAILKLPVLDKDFYDHIDDIKAGYVNMYPKLKFDGKVEVEEIVASAAQKQQEAQNTALLFSGGVDATSSLVSVLKQGESPRLITLWGADVDLKDEAGWREKSGHTRNAAGRLGLEVSFVKTNFREVLDEGVLNRKVSRGSDDKWWHGFQHGIGIIGHAAPFVYLHNIATVYIAASFTRGENMTCASDPTIDEHVHIAGSGIVHAGYDFTRQDKIANIHHYVQEEGIDFLPIKVCWLSSGAKNCGKCEKCIRTAVGFLVEDGDLNVYDLSNYDEGQARHHITSVYYFRHTLQWERIQNRLRENITNLSEENKRRVEWLLDVDLSKVNDRLSKRARRYIEGVAKSIINWLPSGARTPLKRAIKKTGRS